jgi:hypothetical protein
MTKKDYSANALIPHGHHQDWALVEQIVDEMERITEQFPDTETEIICKGSGDLYGRYGSFIDAMVGLGEEQRDVRVVDITRLREEYDNSDIYLSVTLHKSPKETSWVYASGPIKQTCEDLVRRLQKFILEAINHPQAKRPLSGPTSARHDVIPSLELLSSTFTRFPSFLQSLRKTNAPSISAARVNSESDLQVLVGACLRLLFDDVRPEDYVSEYAGGRSRVDFFLPKAGIAVETKMMRDSLSDRKVGDELLIDWGRYASRTDCRGIFALIYDPEMRLRNPAGLEADLTRDHGKPPTKVIVVR